MSTLLGAFGMAVVLLGITVWGLIKAMRANARYEADYQRQLDQVQTQAEQAKIIAEARTDDETISRLDDGTF